jgi:hypothetical protein
MPILWFRSPKSLNCCAYTKFRRSYVRMCMTTFMPILWLRSLKSLKCCPHTKLRGSNVGIWVTAFMPIFRMSCFLLLVFQYFFTLLTVFLGRLVVAISVVLGVGIWRQLIPSKMDLDLIILHWLQPNRPS